MQPDIIHSKDFVNDAVALIERDANEAIATRGLFSMALSGGKLFASDMTRLACFDLREVGHD